MCWRDLGVTISTKWSYGSQSSYCWFLKILLTNLTNCRWVELGRLILEVQLPFNYLGLLPILNVFFQIWMLCSWKCQLLGLICTQLYECYAFCMLVLNMLEFCNVYLVFVIVWFLLMAKKKSSCVATSYQILILKNYFSLNNFKCSCIRAKNL